MLRNHALQQMMSRLALVAVLLMAFAPSVSRWMKGDKLEFLPGLTELCTTVGTQSVDLASWVRDAAKAPAPDHAAMGADCAYCPLLAGIALLLLALTVLFPLLRIPLGEQGSSSPLRASSLFPGLGSRGPPLAL